MSSLAVNCSDACFSDVSLSSFAASVPDTLALAVDEEVAKFRAEKDMSPIVEVMFLEVVEVVLSLMKLSASAAPKPTLLAVTVPSATVVAAPL